MAQQKMRGSEIIEGRAEQKEKTAGINMSVKAEINSSIGFNGE